MDAEIQDHVLNADLNRLEIEHQAYARQLERLHNKAYLSEEDRLEEVRLKKLKLHLKDQMAALRHQQGVLNNV